MEPVGHVQRPPPTWVAGVFVDHGVTKLERIGRGCYVDTSTLLRSGVIADRAAFELHRIGDDVHSATRTRSAVVSDETAGHMERCGHEFEVVLC